MRAKRPKLTTSRYLEILDPGDAVGLWSHRISRTTPMSPVGNTARTLGRSLAEDVSRWETYDDMKSAMDAKGWRGTASRMLREYEAQYLGETVGAAGEREWLSAPRWFRAWRRFALWIGGVRTVPRPGAVRMSFGFPAAGRNSNEGNLRNGRTFFLRDGVGRTFVAVMAVPASDPAWASWLLVEGGHSLPGRPHYDRLVIDPRGGCLWTRLDAALVSELVADGRLCLFRMAPDPVFDAVTDPELNPQGRHARLSADFTFCAEPRDGGAFSFSIRWGATFNPGRTRYAGVDKTVVLTLDVARERRRPWAARPVEVRDASKAEDAARRAVLENGCVLIPDGAPDSLRRAVMHALFFVTFPDRRPDEPGGLLRGYQLPGRMVRRAGAGPRGDNTALIVGRAREIGRARADARRRLVVDTLLGRAARALAARNGLDEGGARSLIESAGGRETLAAAARRLGMLDGNALALFTPKPNAGSLKLPDLSLAFAFEHRLGLKGPEGAADAPVQTAKVRDLADTPGSVRHTIAVVATARRMWKPMPGRENETPEASPAHPPRILREDGRYYLLAVPRRAGAFRYGRDLACGTGGGGPVPVAAYSFRSPGGERSREGVELAVETFDWRKVVRMAQEGRMLLYALDFGRHVRWADAAYLPANSGPCAIATTVPKLVGGKASDDEASVELSFIVNPSARRAGGRRGARSLAAYIGAHPGEAARPRVEFDPADPEGSALEAVRRDALVVARREDAAAALEAMGCVVVPGRGPREPGGLYAGYMLGDRVFAGDAPEAGRRRDPRRGRALADVVRPEKAAELERHFAALIESDRTAGAGIAPELAPAVAREFRRVVCTGTMDARRQLARPAHEVAVGIWLATL